MSSNHTAGPWIVRAYSYSLAVYSSASGERIATIGAASDRAKADAALVAAAPAMLAALRALLRDGMRSDRVNEALDAIAAAVPGGDTEDHP
jgi:hypothetical protein